MHDMRAVKDVVLKEKLSTDGLVRQWKESGGFTGRKVADATDIIEKMERCDGCKIFLSFPACIMATGTRGVLVELVRRHLVDVIITTCGTLDHDLARTWREYYHGDFSLDDAELYRNGICRLGNVLVPDDAYGIVLESKLITLFEEILAGRDSISTCELIDQVGRRIEDEGSLLHWCHRNQVPVYVPGITDGCFGSQLWMYWQTHHNLRVDLFRDEQDLSDITFAAEKTGALIIGGGISKHHTIWWNQYRGGLDFAVYLTTAMEFDGSLSGAQVREAVSWGKVKEGADQITVEGDATITLPIIVSSLIDRLGGLTR